MKPLRIKHVAVVKGVAVGRAYILSREGAVFPKHWIPDKEIAGEITRFKRAIQKSKQQLAKVRDKLCKYHGKEQIQIIDSHSMLLQDEMLVTYAIQNIANQKINAEWAISKAINRLKSAFTDIKNEYFQQRKSDIDYVGHRIINNLVGGAELSLHEIKEPHIIIIAKDLSPADIAGFPRDRVKGFITAGGGPTSHTAIIARSLEFPSVVGVENILNSVKDGDTVVINGIDEEIIINPSKESLSNYRKEQLSYEHSKQELLKDARLPAKTLDGHSISLVANIELLEEITPALQHGAEGVGLFRTEYLYLNRMDYPSEEEQFQCYKTVLARMFPRPVTIRTFDMGGDKLFGIKDYAEHANPALGLRAVRFCLAERDIFITQLRALLRASIFGNLRIMFPMISGVDEVRQVKSLLEETKTSLKKKNIKFNEKLNIGIMIEIPSAVISANVLAKEVDFFSIGTNDLIQYTLAVDRTNEYVSYLYKPLHPAVLKMIKKTVETAKNAGIDVTLCGEMAGDPLYIMLLLGMGLVSLSMNPVSIPIVKKIIRTLAAKDAVMLYKEAAKMTSPDEIEAFVKKEMAKHLKA